MLRARQLSEFYGARLRGFCEEHLGLTISRAQTASDKVSVVYLHEFGHHLLHCRRKPQQEVFPRTFSLSLFYQAAPRMFEAARQSGRLLYTDDGGAHAEQ